MSKIQVSLTISDTHRQCVGDVVKAVRAAGMRVEQRLDEIGVLIGTIDENKLDGLRRVAGVDSVEADRSFQLPPPDSPVQ
jgi:hypothetical protein